MQVAAPRFLALLALTALAAACTSQPTATADPAASAASGNIQISAVYLRYEQASVDVPAGEPFKIDFNNRDAATVHDVVIHRDQANGEVVFKGATFPGPALRTYDVPTLTAGTYAFVCSVHPLDMVGVMNAK